MYISQPWLTSSPVGPQDLQISENHFKIIDPLRIVPADPGSSDISMVTLLLPEAF